MFDAAKCKLMGHSKAKVEVRPRFYTMYNETTGKEDRHDFQERRKICSRCATPLEPWAPFFEDQPAK